ncbi:MAG: HIT domain-containing protein [Candidatus Omnitrophota bacterium]|nr:MAG: HIT domain-containing protein [Candidatus Omnitrophota bacterium]
MDKIWAPWRINYVTQKKRKGCILCRIKKAAADKKNFVILRSSHCYAVLNTFPYNNGHFMVVSNRHICSLDKLSDGQILDMNKTVIKIKNVLKKVLSPNGFNIGINIGRVSGAGVDKHLHIHVVPRWLGDTNFMPVTADTKIVSQSLGALYTQIRKCLQEKK